MSYADIDTTNWVQGTQYWTKITDENHAGWLYIITLLSFVYVLIAFAIRFFVKWGMYGHDDWALLGSTVLAVGQYIMVLIALSKGLGVSGEILGRARILHIQKYSAAHAYLYVLAHCLSKASTALLTQRLFENGRLRNQYLSWALVVAAGAFGLGGVLTLAVGCDNPYSFDCHSRFIRWQTVLALDIISESLLVIIPLILILDILISRTSKITVLAVFGFRIADVVFASLNLHRVGSLRAAEDPVLALVPSMMWTQTELLWSILSASLPCLKTFMRPFDKIDEETWRGNSNVYAIDRSARTWDDWGTNGRESALPAIESKPKRDERAIATGIDGFDFGLRPDNVSHEVEISHPASDQDSNERKSWGSQEHIIKERREFEIKREFEVRRESGSHLYREGGSGMYKI